MRPAFLDVNLLVALAWPNRVHHAVAHAWFRRNQSNGWATCPVSQAGFVRVSSRRTVIPEAHVSLRVRIFGSCNWGTLAIANRLLLAKQGSNTG